ncbi:HAD-superfamily subfamily IIA hydrolase like protein [Psychromonas ingrahamii 37]|uniref:Haloacid dehalogenase-like hydrolase domain-containing protein 2 n=1 Tax=Psychromonas ingrahamii (strain DSM 17664 / CCUG 51855 / 37) TaxID=357804 RepID=A1SVA2_PSYIN|nr:TIGR01458 family HAD-type hydrolase [Psychromonas ingrahamii]ABM03417.1 HAD-superfamily subfamily IIA hydrolase like protein [Psychromonas ingrahamii 37]
MLKALFIDLSGVLYEGHNVIPGAVAAIKKARASQLQLRFVTNTSRRTRTQLLTDLQNLGFDLQKKELFTAPVAVHAWLQEKKLRPYCLIHHNIKSEFADLLQAMPNAVVIGDAEQNFCYDKLNRAFQLCQQGAVLVGIGYNRYFKLEGQLLLDAGPFIKAIEFAALTQAIIIGKPSKDFFLQALASTGLSADQVLMIGDDIYGDIEGAINAGLLAGLVRTGKYQTGDEHKISAAHLTFNSIVDAVDYALSDQSNN